MHLLFVALVHVALATAPRGAVVAPVERFRVESRQLQHLREERSQEAVLLEERGPSTSTTQHQVDPLEGRW